LPRSASSASASEPSRRARVATLTHRHPTSDTAAGFLAALIDRISTGEPLAESVDCTRAVLLDWEEHGSTLDAVDTAVSLAADTRDPHEAIGFIGHVGTEGPTATGKGWVAEEALGIALFCALRFEDDFAAALCAAVNISGDSDSTGALTGAILGVALGAEAIPQGWRERVANRQLLIDLGVQLAAVRDEY
jgi:ADP-ribosylglycohydrolase